MEIIRTYLCNPPNYRKGRGSAIQYLVKVEARQDDLDKLVASVPPWQTSRSISRTTMGNNDIKDKSIWETGTDGFKNCYE